MQLWCWVIQETGIRALLSGDQSYSPDEDRAKKAVHSFPCQSQRHEPITASVSSCIRKKADSAFLSEQCCPVMKQKKQWFASWVSEEAWSWWVGVKWQMVRLGVNVLSEKWLNKNGLQVYWYALRKMRCSEEWDSFVYWQINFSNVKCVHLIKSQQVFGQHHTTVPINLICMCHALFIYSIKYRFDIESAPLSNYINKQINK